MQQRIQQQQLMIEQQRQEELLRLQQVRQDAFIHLTSPIFHFLKVVLSKPGMWLVTVSMLCAWSHGFQLSWTVTRRSQSCLLSIVESISREWLLLICT